MNIWKEVTCFFRKRLWQVIEMEEFYFDEKFLKIREKTLIEYHRVLEKAGYLISKGDKCFVAKDPNISLRTARLQGMEEV